MISHTHNTSFFSVESFLSLGLVAVTILLTASRNCSLQGYTTVTAWVGLGLVRQWGSMIYPKLARLKMIQPWLLAEE